MYRRLVGGGAGVGVGIRLSRRIRPPTICLSTGVGGGGGGEEEDSAPAEFWDEKEKEIYRRLADAGFGRPRRRTLSLSTGVGEGEEDLIDYRDEKEKRASIKFVDEAQIATFIASARAYLVHKYDMARRYVPEHPRRRSGGRLKSPFTVMIEEDLRYNRAETFVFWDMNCTPLPPGADVCDLPWAIKNGLKWGGYFNKEIKLFGYGDQNKVSSQVWNQLRQVGGCYNHHDGGGGGGGDSSSRRRTSFSTSSSQPHYFFDEDASFNSIVKDMAISARKCSSPTNFLLISSNEGFTDALNKLKPYKHNILLARASTQPVYKLESIAFRVWNWEDLVDGGPPLLPQPWNAKYSTFFNN